MGAAILCRQAPLEPPDKAAFRDEAYQKMSGQATTLHGRGLKTKVLNQETRTEKLNASSLWRTLPEDIPISLRPRTAPLLEEEEPLPKADTLPKASILTAVTQPGAPGATSGEQMAGQGIRAGGQDKAEAQHRHHGLGQVGEALRRRLRTSGPRRM